MRKKLELALLIASYVFGFFAVVLLTVVSASNPEASDLAAQLHMSLMRSIVYVISVLFIVSAVGYCYAAFGNSKAVNEILVYQSESSRTKASKSVIRKLIRDAIGTESVVKLDKVKLLVIDGTLHLIIYISLTGANAPYHVDYLKALISNVLAHTLKLSNYRTDFKIKKLESNYEVPREEILKDVETRYEQEVKGKDAECAGAPVHEPDSVEAESVEMPPEENE